MLHCLRHFIAQFVCCFNSDEKKLQTTSGDSLIAIDIISSFNKG